MIGCADRLENDGYGRAQLAQGAAGISCP